MPTYLKQNGFRFYFYSNENKEPIHVHVEKAEGNAKYWLEPDEFFAYAHNFNSSELNFIEAVIKSNSEKF